MCVYHNACYGGTIVETDADALEAAEKRIAELEKQHGNQLTRNIMLTAQIPKEGEWIWDSDTGTYLCSECNATSPREDQDGDYIDCPNYCPNCGARMDGKDGERDGRTD
jgi:DNA-directed RNA polymerase subunit RPC12/RpoP